jgi:hypothetical protein
MMSRTRKLILGALVALPTVCVQAGLSEEQLAWHWDPATDDLATQATLALAIWLDDEPTDFRQWRERVTAQRLALASAAQRVPVDQALLADGMFASLMQARLSALPIDVEPMAVPTVDGLADLLRPERQPGRLARMQRLMAFVAPRVWSDLREGLAAAADAASESETETAVAIDVDAEIDAFWRSVLLPPETSIPHPETELGRTTPAENDEPEPEASGQPAIEEIEDNQEQDLPQPSEAARKQASRLLQLFRQSAPDLAPWIDVQLLRDDAELAWSEGRQLAASWMLLHALAEVAVREDPQAIAAELTALLEAFGADPGRALRELDTDLPVVLALLEDAALQLTSDPPNRNAALLELGDAYARLALFAGDASFYMDQPVREDVRAAMDACSIDPALVGPLPREVFERCLERLVGLMGESLGREELVGDGDGPFSDLFLRREMSLVSWQRVAYLDGHLNWLLAASCEPPAWQNPLEWSLLAHYLSRWVAQRPVFFDSPRWREAVDAFEQQAAAQREATVQFIDCLTGFGSERLDPVQRLIDRHALALDRLSEAIDSAEAEFYAAATRPSADIDLDGDAEQPTNYRPEGLTIGPCAGAEVCGVRAELPVSRALLSGFPNAFLLADQLRIGQLDLCYENVRWVDRQARPTRSQDPRVANYEGHLSFDLIGTFERSGGSEVVFRQRLRAAQATHYLFASSDPEVLEMTCPDALAGQPISSRLPDDHLGLVPDRLTYFVSQPTTAEAELLANWDRGAEWRDWFVTGDRVERLENSDGRLLAGEVEAELDRLSRQLEREISGRLLSRLSLADLAPDPLSSAMATVAENTALLRRILEIHYPRVIRHDQQIRSSLTGEAGLLNRDRVRQLTDSASRLSEAAALGRTRLEVFRARWLTLPVELRESGQVSPELDFAAERLAELRQLSRSWLGASAESSPDP